MSPESMAMIDEACNISIFLWFCYIMVELLYRGFKKTPPSRHSIAAFIMSICRILRPILLVTAIIASLFTPAGATITFLAIIYGLFFIFIARKI